MWRDPKLVDWENEGPCLSPLRASLLPPSAMAVATILPNFCFHNFGGHCGDQFLLFLHQNAPDRVLKVKNFPGVIPPDAPREVRGGARSAHAWIRQFAMADWTAPSVDNDINI